ncbi:MAG: signal transduction protein [Burkholderiales bacterium 68-12]|nr:MAG: signal transduction protein [Burkholderiales bacterium 68-12]
MAARTVLQSITQRHLVSLGPQASVRDAARAMAGAQCGSVLILDTASGTLLGILTERDLMVRVLARDLDPQTTRAEQVMTPAPRTVPPDTPVAQAVLTMLEQGFRHLPIVSATGAILGVLSMRDALPREISDAVSLAEFNDQVNDALG